MKRVLIGLEQEEILIIIKALRESQMTDGDAQVAVELHDRLVRIVSGT